MFTGLVEEMGACHALEMRGASARLTVASADLAPSVHIGDSVAVNGCCLTVTARDAHFLSFDLLAETLDKTNLHALRPGSSVNLERALAADGRLGGHFVQGHVDTVTRLVESSESGTDLRLDFLLDRDFARYIAYKGSVAINGVSLTVADLGSETFTIWIIPHTRAVTNLGSLQPGDLVNLECDILAKYAERILAPSS